MCSGHASGGIEGGKRPTCRNRYYNNLALRSPLAYKELFAIFSGDDEDVLAFEVGAVEAGQKRRERAALDGLELLGQVVGESGIPVAVDFEGIAQAGFQAVWAFIEDERVRRVFVDLQEAAARAGLARWKAAEGEAVDRQAGEHQRHDERGRAGNEGDGEAGGDGAAHERKARVGDTRRARVGDHGDRLALLQHTYDTPPGLRLVVLVERNLRLLDVEMLEEQAGLAGVLAGDHIGLAQGVQRA